MRIYMISVCLSTYLVLFLIFLFLLHRGINLRLRKRHYSGRWRFEHISFAMACRCITQRSLKLGLRKFPYSCGNSKFNTTSLKVLSTISDLFVLYLQSMVPSAGLRRNLCSKRSYWIFCRQEHQSGLKKRSLRLHDATSTGQQIRLICGSQCENQKKGLRKFNEFAVSSAYVKNAGSGTEDVGSALPMHLECTSSNDVPLMFQGKISGARHIRFFWFELSKQPDGPTKWKSKRIWMVETSWKQAQRNHLDSHSASNVHITCNGQATRSPTSASRRHFCTRTWVHKCLPFLMAGVPVEPVEPIRFHLDSVRFVFEVRIGWLLAFENLCCENYSTWVYMIKTCCVCGHCVSFCFISCFGSLLSTPLQRDSLFWPKRFGPEKAKHRVIESWRRSNLRNSRDARGIAGKLGKITASIVPSFHRHVLSSPLRQVPVGLRPLEPFTKSGVSPKANHQLPKHYLTPWMSNDMQWQTIINNFSKQ